MKIVLTGGTGFLGRHLSSYLQEGDFELIQLRRSDYFSLDHVSKLIKSADVIINLAGSPVLKRWTDANKKEILESRILTTNRLVEAILQLQPEERPSLIISASAIGVYNAELIHSEDSTDFASDFLADVCQQWESCLDPLKSENIRTCVIRIGIVLGSDGGMLQRLLSVFKLGLGGCIGSGKQGFSFIHVLDFCRAIGHLINNNTCQGVYNMVSPDVSSNERFTKTLAKLCHRPAFFTVPGMVLKLMYGEASVIVTGGQSVYPKRLLESGFKYEFPNLERTLRSLVLADDSTITR